MLSYRHAFHAGNFADVMKHVVLTALLRYLTRKDAAICYIDTHAGPGGYDLHSGFARKTAESELGIGRIWNAGNVPALVSDYRDRARRFNRSEALEYYPGSPWIAADLLRKQDRLMLCELHASDYPHLERRFGRDRRVHCFAENGYRFSLGLVPPAERRGLIFIDPSYELKDEYDTAVETLGKLHRRFATGMYALWYPILDERRVSILQKAMQRLQVRDVLNLELVVASPKTRPGMYGCGMVLVNAPWTLRQDMEVVLPFLSTVLAQDGESRFGIEQWAAE
jgi:23S rRNA (adenine2030-N6)-methyltransferase